MPIDTNIPVHGRYVLGDKLGSGSSGTVYRAVDRFNRHIYAVKVERMAASVLGFENEVLKAVHEGGKAEGFPVVFCYGRHLNHYAMAMTYLGSSLERLLNHRSRRFSVKTALMVGLQLLRRVKHLHRKGFIHGDIKPPNILTGAKKDDSTIYLVDFGCGQHCPPEGSAPTTLPSGPVGTPAYMSVGIHKGRALCRADDLEAIGYVVVDLFKGILPWTGILKKNFGPRHMTLILGVKEKLPLGKLCEGLPKEVEYFLRHVRGLSFGQVPDYKLLMNYLRDALHGLGFEDDGRYDWTPSGS